VGITTAIISPSGAYAGNSFAIPINIVRKVVEDLQEYGEVQRAIIGVNIIDVTSELAEQENIDNLKGVYVTDIVSGGAAEEAGMKTGDIIINFDGKKTDTAAELQERVSRKRPGDRVRVVVMRNNKRHEYDIVLRNLAGGTDVVVAGEDSGVIFGVRLEPLTLADKSEYRVNTGMKVTGVQDGRFQDLGIREGYIILEVNGEEINSYKDIKNATRDGAELESLKGLQSNGTYFSYQFRK